MKVLLLNGSPNAEGCTYTALCEVAKPLQAAGVETELVQLGKGPVQGCVACDWCAERGRCVHDDLANRLIEKMETANGLVVGSPVYYAGPNGALCAVLDRMFFAGSNGFAGKLGAAVVSCRRAGSTASLDRLNKYFTISRMPLVPSQYWNMVHGFTPDEVRQDEEGLQTMRTLGREMAHLLGALEVAGPTPPSGEARAWTNFIR